MKASVGVERVALGQRFAAGFALIAWRPDAGRFFWPASGVSWVTDGLRLCFYLKLSSDAAKANHLIYKHRRTHFTSG